MIRLSASADVVKAEKHKGDNSQCDGKLNRLITPGRFGAGNSTVVLEIQN